MPNNVDGDMRPLEKMVVDLALGLRCRKDDSASCSGSLWQMDPGWGTGSLWYHVLDGAFAFVCFDLAFDRPASFAEDTPEIFCFGSFNQGMEAHLSEVFDRDEYGSDVLFGYAWTRSRFGRDIAPGEHVRMCSVAIASPLGMENLAAECGCHPDLLGAAISSLDGRAAIPELRQVFEQIRRASPSEATAAPFFRAKLVEASTLVLDWYSRDSRHGNRVGAADMIAFNKARNLIVANLDRTVSMHELCHEANMSENKLADVFKRVEGATPQEFARAQKLALAAHLIAHTDLPLSAISARVGYGLQGSFSTAFKRQYGTTPRDYRRSSSLPSAIPAPPSPQRPG